MNKIELLLPARDLSCGKIAINHGADAVYIGAQAFGARQAATNSIQDIEELVNYAHLFGAKVHVTVNTVVFDSEIPKVERLLRDLYNIGVDAVLIQDLGILKMNVPPLNFHASTQCHNNTLERVQFLEKLGFSRVVLARETDLNTIRNIRQNTNIELEAFVHGALCVCYSGQCYISAMLSGRSGNRGECAQICRTRFNLLDANDNTLISNKHLLSIRDMCRADFIEEMMLAGISSFKVEGRLKNENYVKNITAFYRKKIDNILENNPNYQKSSSGKTCFLFSPDVNKSFNRGYTSYFIDSKREKIASFDTPKAVGEKIGFLSYKNDRYFYEGNSKVVNGDGLCFINENGEIEGFFVNGVKNNEIIPQKNLSNFKKVKLYRNIDKEFEKILNGKTAERKILIDFSIVVSKNQIVITAKDEDGIQVSESENIDLEVAHQPDKMNQLLKTSLSKLGNTIFETSSISIDNQYFIQSKIINEIKQRLLQKFEIARIEHFKTIDSKLKYSPENIFQDIDYQKNITNEFHKSVYEDFGAENVEYGLDKTKDFKGKTLMTCKYCIRYELGWCSKTKGFCPPFPLFLESGNHKFRLSFDCKNCVMKVETRH